MQKYHPILFSTQMVQAIMEGRKTMTRRIEKMPPAKFITDTVTNRFYGESGREYKCPYGQVGDVLWVREEFYQFGHWEKDFTRKRKTNRQAWKFVADNPEILYSDNPPHYFKKGRHHNEDAYSSHWYKRLGRFMPKAAARIFLEINDIRVERLQDISEEDAKKEGYSTDGDESAKIWFSMLWSKINGEESWKANPFVWVISFEKITKPENFK